MGWLNLSLGLLAATVLILTIRAKAKLNQGIAAFLFFEWIFSTAIHNFIAIGNRSTYLTCIDGLGLFVIGMLIVANDERYIWIKVLFATFVIEDAIHILHVVGGLDNLVKGHNYVGLLNGAFVAQLLCTLVGAYERTKPLTMPERQHTKMVLDSAKGVDGFKLSC